MNTQKKPFDINLYLHTVNVAQHDFLEEKLPYFIHNTKLVLKKFPMWFKALPNDEKVAFVTTIIGPLLVLVGLIRLLL